MEINAIIYVRVSRKDQDYDRQIHDLETVANARGWKVVEIITEKISGSKSKRDGLDRLKELVEAGEIKKILVTEISRLGRKTLDVLQLVDFLTTKGVSIYIHNFSIETLQPNGKKNPMVSMMLTILAEFATMEKENLKDRIRSGLEHAKRKGSKLGRPEGSNKDDDKLLEEYKNVVKSLKKGLSIREAAKVNDVSATTVFKIKKAMGQ
jgi:DNA invertase Pin-like site-specific DNA recombinase